MSLREPSTHEKRCELAASDVLDPRDVGWRFASFAEVEDGYDTLGEVEFSTLALERYPALAMATAELTRDLAPESREVVAGLLAIAYMTGLAHGRAGLDLP